MGKIYPKLEKWLPYQVKKPTSPELKYYPQQKLLFYFFCVCNSTRKSWSDVENKKKGIERREKSSHTKLSRKYTLAGCISLRIAFLFLWGLFPSGDCSFWTALHFLLLPATVSECYWAISSHKNYISRTFRHKVWYSAVRRFRFN